MKITYSSKTFFCNEKQFFLEHRNEHVLSCFIIISEHVLILKIKNGFWK